MCGENIVLDRNAGLRLQLQQIGESVSAHVVDDRGAVVIGAMADVDAVRLQRSHGEAAAGWLHVGSSVLRIGDLASMEAIADLLPATCV